MPSLRLNGIDLHYAVSGEGPPLLLLAGLLSDSASWGPLVPLLSAHHQVIRPDNRTTGRTQPWDAPVTIAQMAEDAAALMPALGHEHYHVAGHSMGGLIAMELSALSKLRSLQILCSAPVRVPRTMAMFETLVEIRAGAEDPSLWLRALYPWAFQPKFFETPAKVEAAVMAALAYPYAQSLPAMRLQIEALRSYRPDVKPRDIKVPTQVLFAEHDLMIPQAPARAVFADIDGVQMHEVPNAGHSVHWDAPEATAQYILSFTGATI